MKAKVNSLKDAQELELKHYDLIYSDKSYWQNSCLRYDILERIKFSKHFINKNSNVLDVGCGGGGVSIGISNFVSNIIGIDISKEGIKYANSLKPQNADFFCISIEDFIKKNKLKFDVILFFECLEHLYDGEKAIEQLSKLLNPGGFIIISTPNYNRLVYKFIRGPIGRFMYYLTQNEMFKFKITHSHIREFSVNDVKNILRKNSFKIIKHKGRIIWTDPVFTLRPNLFQRLNIVLGNICPSIAGYMYIVARFKGK